MVILLNIHDALAVALIALAILPEASSAPPSGMTNALREAIVRQHNDIRSKEGASDMTLIRYEYALEDTAAAWANKCTYSHAVDDHSKFPDCASNVCGQYQGENVYVQAQPDDMIITNGVQAWFQEKGDYTFGDGLFRQENCASGKECAHYTQLVSRGSLMVGCAVKRDCDGQYPVYVVCQYHPAGNMKGEVIYTKGNSCTSCGIGFNCCETFECVGETPPDVTEGTYEWDVGCDGKNVETMELGKCTKAPSGGDWGSHIARITVNHRTWGLKMIVFEDFECKVRKFNTAIQDLNQCSSAIGFANKVTYTADLMKPPPADSLVSQEEGQCPRPGQALTEIGAVVSYGQASAAAHHEGKEDMQEKTGFLRWTAPPPKHLRGLRRRTLFQMDASELGTCDVLEE